jgi:hypothetical protein
LNRAESAIEITVFAEEIEIKVFAEEIEKDAAFTGIGEIDWRDVKPDNRRLTIPRHNAFITGRILNHNKYNTAPPPLISAHRAL